MPLGLTFLDAVEAGVVNIVNAYLPTSAQDTVAVFDSDFNQLFPDARPLAVDVKETAKEMKHPVESGGVVTDWRVIQPIAIDIKVVLKAETYNDTYDQIKAVFTGLSLVQVQTKTGLYPNMLMLSPPHKEDAAHFDTITMDIKFVESLIVTTSTSALPPSATTTNGGNKNATPATAGEIANSRKNATDNGTAAQGIAHYFGGS